MSESELDRARARALSVRMEKQLRRMAQSEDRAIVERVRAQVYDNYPELLRGARI